MADHYMKSVELLEEIADLRKQLRNEYARPQHRRDKIADLHGALGRTMKLAGIHADLAKVQALEDLHALLDERLVPGVALPKAAGL